MIQYVEHLRILRTSVPYNNLELLFAQPLSFPEHHRRAAWLSGTC